MNNKTAQLTKNFTLFAAGMIFAGAIQYATFNMTDLKAKQKSNYPISDYFVKVHAESTFEGAKDTSKNFVSYNDQREGLVCEFSVLGDIQFSNGAKDNFFKPVSISDLVSMTRYDTLGPSSNTVNVEDGEKFRNAVSEYSMNCLKLRDTVNREIVKRRIDPSTIKQLGLYVGNK